MILWNDLLRVGCGAVGVGTLMSSCNVLLAALVRSCRLGIDQIKLIHVIWSSSFKIAWWQTELTAWVCPLCHHGDRFHYWRCGELLHALVRRGVGEIGRSYYFFTAMMYIIHGLGMLGILVVWCFVSPRSAGRALVLVLQTGHWMNRSSCMLWNAISYW